jgi:hypothetical protein
MKLVAVVCSAVLVCNLAGFAQPTDASCAIGVEPVEESTIEFRTRNSLIIVPVVINDTMRVMLAVDPHCSSLVLFGKKYERMVRASLGIHSDDSPSEGVIANNKISIGPVIGRNVPILVVANTNPLNFFTSVHGVIGSHYFDGYNLRIDHKKQELTFTPAIDKTQGHIGQLQNPKSAIDLFNFD